eukprot:GHVQ01024622.1.p2 GENE.GHVQ01024622.1~~GHVQ01024622.1.p2  ORF type:complete len:280 (-),score=50.90 GHVQ01024622.1:1727-2566(-)
MDSHMGRGNLQRFMSKDVYRKRRRTTKRQRKFADRGGFGERQTGRYDRATTTARRIVPVVERPPSAPECGDTSEEGIKIIDEIGKISPEISQVVSRMTIADVAALLLNIQRLVVKTPAIARKALTECVELTEALLHAQLLTGMMNDQITQFSALSHEDTSAAYAFWKRRQDLKNDVCSQLLKQPSTEIPVEVSETEDGNSSTQQTRDLSPRIRGAPPVPSDDMMAGLRTLADEVISNPVMLAKIINTTSAEVDSFPDEQRTKVFNLRQILQGRGYAIAQ